MRNSKKQVEELVARLSKALKTELALDHALVYGGYAIRDVKSGTLLSERGTLREVCYFIDGMYQARLILT